MKKRIYFICILTLLSILALTLAACNNDEWSVTFDQNYEGAPEPVTITVANEEKIPEQAFPERAGYTFKGWFFDRECTSEVVFADGGSTEAVTSDYTVYAKWEVNAPAPAVVSLSSISATYKGAEPEINGSLKASDFEVTAKYSDNTTKKVTNFSISQINSSTAGEKDVTVSYSENNVTKTTTVKVTVKAPAQQPKALASIAAVYNGNEIEINGSVAKADITVTATYDDDSTSVLSDFVLGTADFSTFGEKTVEISYTEGTVTKTASISVYVKGYFTVSYYNENAWSGVKAYAFSGSGETLKVYLAEGTASTAGEDGWFTLAIDNRATKIVFSDDENSDNKTAELSIDVEKLFYYDGEWVATKPIKTLVSIVAEYSGNDLAINGMLDQTKITVSATYNYGAVKVVEGFTPSVPDTTTVGEKEVTVTYTENEVTKTATFTVTVVKALSSIDATFTGGDVYVDDEITTSDFTVKAIFDDSSESNVTNFSMSGADTTDAGDITVTISYTVGDTTKTDEVVVEVKPILLVSIEVAYSGGDIAIDGSIDQSKITVTATYNHGEPGTVTGYTLSTLDSTTAGEKEITVTYTENEVTKTATFSVTVVKALSSIEATFTGGEVFVGDEITTSDFTVKAIFDDNSESNVTSFSISGADTAVAGAITVTVTYMEKTDDVEVTVKSIALDSITAEYKGGTKYVGDTISVSDFTVNAIYNDVRKNKLVNEGIALTGNDTSSAGEKSITVSYTDAYGTKSSVVKVTIVEKTLQSIAAEYKGGKKIVGSTLANTDFTVTATFDKGPETVTDFSVGAFDSSSIGEKEVDISYTYGGITKETKVYVTVLLTEDGYYIMGINGNWGDSTYKMALNGGNANEVMLLSVTVDGVNDAIKIVKQAGSSLNYYSAVKTGEYGVDTNLYTQAAVSDDITLKAYTYDFYFDFSVERLYFCESPLRLVSILAELKDGVTKYVGDTISASDFTVTATYNKAASNGVVTEGIVLAGNDTTTAGEKNITITYTEGGIEKTDTVQVTVNPLVLASIAAVYSGGDIAINGTLDGTKITVTATYEHGKSKAVTGYTLSTLDSTTAGEKEITVTYTESGVTKTANFSVKVVKALSSIDATFTGGDVYVDDEITTSDFTVKAIFDDNSESNVTSFSISGADTSTAKIITVTVTYMEKTDEVQVTVKPIALVSITAEYKGGTKYVGDTISASDFTVTANYNNGSTRPVSGSLKETVDTTTAGSKAVTIAYTENEIEKTVTEYVNITAIVLNSITAEYKGGKKYVGDTISASDFTVNATYNDVRKNKVVNEGIALTGNDTSSAGEKSITVSYTDAYGTKSSVVKVAIVEKTLQSIDAEYKGGKKIVGSTLANTDFTVTATFDKGPETVTDFSVGAFDSTSIGEKEVVISYTYGGITKETKVYVTVLLTEDGYYIMGINGNWGDSTYKMASNGGNANEVMLLSVTVDGDNDAIKIVKQAGSNLNYYSAVKTGEYGVDTNLYTQAAVSDDITLKAYTYDFYFDFSVERLYFCESPLRLVSILAELKDGVTKYVGDTISASDFTVTATYNKAASNGVVTEGIVLAGNDTTTAGEKNITITYTEGGIEKTDTVQVTVNPLVLASIAAAYSGGDIAINGTLDGTKITVTATYEHGKSKAVTGYTLSTLDSTTAGEKEITVTYTESGVTKTATFSVTVVKALSSIEATFTGGDVYVDDEITTSDFTVKAIFDDNSESNVTNFSISGANTSTAKTITVTVTYMEKTDTVQVTVNPLALVSIEATYSGGTVAINGSIDQSKIAVTATYNHGTPKAVTGFSLSGFTSTTAGEKTVTVSYTHNDVTKTDTISVTVVKALSSIAAAFTGERKTVGSTLASTDFTVTATFDSGTETVTGFSVGAFDSTSIGGKSVGISYTYGEVTKETTVDVTVFLAEDGYYIMGINGNWGDSSYKLEVNPENTNEVTKTGVEVDGVNDAIKIVKQAENTLSYYSTLKTGVDANLYTQATPDSNITLKDNTYDFYFTIAGESQVNELWIAKTPPEPEGKIYLSLNGNDWATADAVICCYVWYSDGTNNAWPGSQMVYDEEDALYYIEYDTTKTVSGVKFSRWNPSNVTFSGDPWNDVEISSFNASSCVFRLNSFSSGEWIAKA